jgi:hypothetical protein
VKVIKVRLQEINKDVIASRLISREQDKPTTLAM